MIAEKSCVNGVYAIPHQEKGQPLQDPLKHLSWSRVRQYLHCAKAFEFHYVLGIEQEFTPPSLAIGLAVHRVAETGLERLLEGRVIPGAEEIEAVVTQEFAGCRWSDPAKTQTNLDTAVRCGISLVSALPSIVVGDIVGIEEPFERKLWPELPPVVGRVDLITLSDNGPVLTDFKTTRAAWNEIDVRMQEGQLALYGGLIDGALALPGVKSKLQFVTVSKGKKPVVAVHGVTQPDRLLEPLKQQFEQVVRGIEAGVFPARPDRHCLTCAFRARCPHAI